MKSRRLKHQEAIMSPQMKKQKTEETLIGHGKDVPLTDSSPLMINSSSSAPISNESRNLFETMAAVNQYERRVENGASQTRHQEHSSTNGNHESNILVRTATPETKQEEPGNGTDGKQDPKPKPSWFTLLGGHALDFDDAEYIEEEEYPAYGITISVSEDGSEVDVRNPTYFAKESNARLILNI